MGENFVFLVIFDTCDVVYNISILSTIQARHNVCYSIPCLNDALPAYILNFLTSFASKVTVVHRRDSFRAEAILQERLFANPKVEVVWDHEVEEVLGQTDPMGVTGVRLKSTRSGETRELACDGVFIAIGHAPASALFAGQLEMDGSGYLKVQAGTASTAIRGVFAAGDVTDDVYRQAVTAAGMGCMAALEAVRLLAEEDHAASRAAAQ